MSEYWHVGSNTKNNKLLLFILLVIVLYATAKRMSAHKLLCDTAY